MFPRGLFDRQARADRRGHGLLHQIDFAGARAISRILHGALFHRRDFAGHADHDARMHQHAPVVRLLDEIGEHLFGDLEIGDHAVLHRLDGHHVARRAAQHVLGFAAHRHHFAAVLVDGHDGRLVHHDALSLCENTSVLAVPRSIARSDENKLKTERKLYPFFISFALFPWTQSYILMLRRFPRRLPPRFSPSPNAPTIHRPGAPVDTPAIARRPLSGSL